VLMPGTEGGATRRVALWTFCDNLRGGAVLNAVRIAERVADLRAENAT